jgi:hypothetical protein
MLDDVTIADVIEKDWFFLDSAGANFAHAHGWGTHAGVAGASRHAHDILCGRDAQVLTLRAPGCHARVVLRAGGVKEEHDEVRCFHLQGGGGGRGRGRTHGGSHTGEIQQLHVVIVCYFPRMAISAAALTFFSRITNNLYMVHLGMSTS